jgi:hypothetical protein
VVRAIEGRALGKPRERIDDLEQVLSFDVPAHRSIISIAAMIVVRAAFASTVVCLLLAGCGPSAVPPSIAARPDVIITLDGKHHACVVALYSEAQGSKISCDDVVPFVRDELRLKSGAIYDIRIIPDVDEAETARVGASLNGAGYRFIGGHAMSATGAHKPP